MLLSHWLVPIPFSLTANSLPAFCGARGNKFGRHWKRAPSSSKIFLAPLSPCERFELEACFFNHSVKKTVLLIMKTTCYFSRTKLPRFNPLCFLRPKLTAPSFKSLSHALWPAHAQIRTLPWGFVFHRPPLPPSNSPLSPCPTPYPWVRQVTIPYRGLNVHRACVELGSVVFHADILFARHTISPPQRTFLEEERLRGEPKECLRRKRYAQWFESHQQLRIFSEFFMVDSHLCDFLLLLT